LFPSFSDAFLGNKPLFLDKKSITKLYLETFENHVPNLLSSTGLFQCVLQSTGGQYNILVNDEILKPLCSVSKMDLLVNVLHKELIPFKLERIVEHTQRQWEKEFGWTTDCIKQKIESYVQSLNSSKGEPVYLYTELVQGRWNHSGVSDFTLYPVYNPEKSDFLYNQSQMLNH